MLFVSDELLVHTQSHCLSAQMNQNKRVINNTTDVLDLQVTFRLSKHVLTPTKFMFQLDRDANVETLTLIAQVWYLICYCFHTKYSVLQA